MKYKAFVDTADFDELCLDVVDLGLIPLGNIVHDFEEGDDIDIEIFFEKTSDTLETEYYPSILADPIKIWVKLPKEDE